MLSSVTRLGEILTVWQNSKSLWQIVMLYLVIGSILNLCALAKQLPLQIARVRRLD